MSLSAKRVSETIQDVDEFKSATQRLYSSVKVLFTAGMNILRPVLAVINGFSII